jgi:phage baseplate assembly protein W
VATLQDILSPVWTLDKNGGGAIVEGIVAIRQAIMLIVSTTKGSDPLRPNFGCDAIKYLDAPVNVAKPQITKALYDAIATWEPRVTVSKITSTLVGTSNLAFSIGYTLVDTTVTSSLILQLQNGQISAPAVPTRLTLNGLLPPNANNYAYTISLSLNNNTCYPLPPATGFNSAQDLYNWIAKNWSNYGNWYLTASAIVGSINPQYTTGSITISLITGNTYKVPIYPLNIGNTYAVSVTVNGAAYNSSTPLYTSSDILNYVQNDTTLGALGSWSLQPTDGDYNNDYNSDFAKQYVCLALVTNDTVSINISQEASA